MLKETERSLWSAWKFAVYFWLLAFPISIYLDVCLILHLADNQMPDTWITGVSETRFSLLMNDLSLGLAWSNFQATFAECFYSTNDHVLSFWLRSWSLKMALVSVSALWATVTPYLLLHIMDSLGSCSADLCARTYVCRCLRAMKACFSATLFSFKGFPHKNPSSYPCIPLVGCSILIDSSSISPSNHSL